MIFWNVYLKTFGYGSEKHRWPIEAKLEVIKMWFSVCRLRFTKNCYFYLMTFSIYLLDI